MILAASSSPRSSWMKWLAARTSCSMRARHRSPERATEIAVREGAVIAPEREQRLLPAAIHVPRGLARLGRARLQARAGHDLRSDQRGDHARRSADPNPGQRRSRRAGPALRRGASPRPRAASTCRTRDRQACPSDRNRSGPARSRGSPRLRTARSSCDTGSPRWVRREAAPGSPRHRAGRCPDKPCGALLRLPSSAAPTETP